jgi:putative two-component system response regulator
VSVSKWIKALVVDDTELNNRIYSRLLQKAGVTEPHTFTTSQEALGWAAVHDASLVILDFKMAPPDGLQFIEFIRRLQHHADTPIIMITGESEREVRYRALERGVADFLTKPIDPPEFIARARNLVALRESRRALSIQANYLADQATWLAAEVRKVTAKLRERERETIHGLTRAAEFRDSETAMHIVRIGMFSAELGRAVGMPEDDVDMLQLAAPMHDIGKVATPDHILLKAGPLNDAEWRIMQEHTVAGYEILKESGSELLRRGAEIAVSHHEKVDGTGYPHGLLGEEIPLWGRICAICDVFDALTSSRPYKAEWPVAQAIEKMTGDSGTHFDARMLSAFFGVLPKVNEIKERFSDAA